MIPGMNPRQMRMAMKKLGIEQEEIAAKEVIIRLDDAEIVISNPQVAKVNMMGQQTYQIVGEESIREVKPDISDEDVETVAGTAGVDAQTARQALEECGGDLAQAIMSLKAPDES